jgi:hypothetical protein
MRTSDTFGTSVLKQLRVAALIEAASVRGCRRRVAMEMSMTLYVMICSVSPLCRTEKGKSNSFPL